MIGIYLFKLDSKNLKDVLDIKNLDFIWVASKNTRYLKQLRDAGLKLFYPYGVVGPRTEYEKKFAAVDKLNRSVSPIAGLYDTVCPNNPTIRKRRLRDIKRFMDSQEATYYDGLYLDAIRYPTYWENKNVVYLDTCYCPTCKGLFSKQSRDWTRFRVTQIEDLVIDIRKLVSGKRLGYFAVPETYQNLERVFAQVPDVLNKHFDFVSPMIYPQMVGKNLNWVKDTIDFFRKYFGKDQVISIIQTSKMPRNSGDRFDYTDAKELANFVGNNGHFGYFALDLIKPAAGHTRAEVVNSYLE